jgi:hypothetical protein
MPVKIATICYVHNTIERLIQDYTVKEITGVTRFDDDDPTNVVYLRIKAFIPYKNIECKIEDFEAEHAKGGILYMITIYRCNNACPNLCNTRLLKK